MPAAVETPAKDNSELGSNSVVTEGDKSYAVLSGIADTLHAAVISTESCVDYSTLDDNTGTLIPEETVFVDSQESQVYAGLPEPAREPATKHRNYYKTAPLGQIQEDQHEPVTHASLFASVMGDCPIKLANGYKKRRM